MWCLTADHDAKCDDGIMIAGQFLRHHRNLDRAEHPNHSRVIEATPGGHLAGAVQQRVADLSVPAAGDNRQPHTRRIQRRQIRHPGATLHKAPPNSPGRCTDS
ncbi:Uncharacterised protein [Mycobacterium tuberculosis]|nr:Uncharacterised protein [Mycobacterium tuberculosis]